MASDGVERWWADCRKSLYCMADRPVGGMLLHPSRPLVRTLTRYPSFAGTALCAVLLATALHAAPAAGQVVDETMVPRGQLRLQAHPIFTAWDSRFGRSWDGTESLESLGSDLTDPATVGLFPGVPMLRDAVRSVTGLAGYEPVLGATDGRVTQDVTRVDLGGHLGVTDWLNIGVIVPWTRSRTAIDLFFTPDLVNQNVGLNPTITNPGATDIFLTSTQTAQTAATAYATSMCAGGAGAGCTAAQDLAARTDAFAAAMRTAYGASPFFPLSGSASGAALLAAAAALNADLTGAGLTGLSTMALAAQPIDPDEFALITSQPGAGIDAGALQTRKGLWRAGDTEVSARVRLLDAMTTEDGGARTFGMRVHGTFLVRLPTATPEHPDILLDIGAGDAQTDLEGSMAVQLGFGNRGGLALSGTYGRQGSVTRAMRVAPREMAIPPASTTRDVTWSPGDYVGFEVAPVLVVSPGLSITGSYRFFHKMRDEFALASPDPTIDPVVLALESGVKAHLVGGGLRYDTVEPWARGEAPRPMELHLRYLSTVAGSGGHVPKTTRIEAGVRMFRRFWGPTR